MPSDTCEQGDSTKAVDVFKEALSLYNGDYLPNAQTEEWLWSTRNYYRNLLKNTMLKMDKFLKDKNEYERLEKFYEEVQPLIKFDEEIIAGFLKTMIEMDRTSEAQQRFNEIRDMYKEEGLVLPPLLKNIFAEM
ncbi:MAG: bacterial transcriptional activator domain-containing protein, partial [Bacteroidota bacterium]